MARKQLDAREKSMIIVLLLLVVILLVKSLYIDGVKDLSGDEYKFAQFVDITVEERYEGNVIYEKGIIKTKTTKLYLADDTVETKVSYYDPQTNEIIEETIDGRYTAVVRHYLFGVLPFKQSSITAAIVEE